MPSGEGPLFVCPGVTAVWGGGDLVAVTFPPPPQPPHPPREPRRRLALHVTLMLVTLGLWIPFWVLVWWTADARYYAEVQRWRREWAAYEVALADWRWRCQVYGGPPPGGDLPLS